MIKRIRIFSVVTLCLLLTCFASLAQEGKIVRETIYSPSLEGNILGDSPNRSVTIYLPPSYDNGDNLAYPVVYLLHGGTGNNELWMGGSYVKGVNIVNSMKQWLLNGKVKEMILVMPNTYNKLTMVYCINSTTAGNWGDFISRDLVEYIDKKYRTLPQRESRGIMGHSIGADSSIRIGILYNSIFAHIGCLAAMFDLEDYMNTNRINYALASKIKDWAQFNSSNRDVRWSFVEPVSFAPNPDKPPFFCDFPYMFNDNNEIVKNQEAYDKFIIFDPLKMAEEHVDTLMEMKSIFIDCGINDDFGLIAHARKFHDELNKLSVNHIYKEFSGNHTCCVMTSTGDALEVFSNAMAFEMVVNVEPAEKLAVTWGQIKN